MRVAPTTALAALAAACASNPDPRHPTLDDAEQRAGGGWITVTQRDGSHTDGELISVEPTVVRVLAWSREGIATPRPDVYASRVEARGLFPARPLALVTIPRSQIQIARLYCYGADSFVGWGIAGGFSTLTHLFLLPITLPIWIGATAGAESAETHAAIIDYPDHNLQDMAIWARFPQGMPPGLPPQSLFPAGAAPGTPRQANR